MTRLMLLGAAALLGASALASDPVSFSPARDCLVQVDGEVYVKGDCKLRTTGQGDVVIGAPDHRYSHIPDAWQFVYILAADHHALWNGPLPESRAHNDLGPVRREGDCWANARARVCATPAP